MKDLILERHNDIWVNGQLHFGVRLQYTSEGYIVTSILNGAFFVEHRGINHESAVAIYESLSKSIDKLAKN